MQTIYNRRSFPCVLLLALLLAPMVSHAQPKIYERFPRDTDSVHRRLSYIDAHIDTLPPELLFMRGGIQSAIRSGATMGLTMMLAGDGSPGVYTNQFGDSYLWVTILTNMIFTPVVVTEIGDLLHNCTSTMIYPFAGSVVGFAIGGLLMRNAVSTYRLQLLLECIPSALCSTLAYYLFSEHRVDRITEDTKPRHVEVFPFLGKDGGGIGVTANW